MNETPISAGSIAQLARFSRLRQHRSSRDRSQSFVIEGIRQFIQASDGGFEFESIFLSPILLHSGIAQKLARRLAARGANKVVLSPERFRSISTTERASGIAAIVRQRWTKLDSTELRHGIGWLIIDEIRSAGNLGTILRTAEAVGMSGAIFTSHDCDPFSPAVVRASMGGIFHIPLIRAHPRELGFWLARNNVTTLGLAPAAPRIWTDLPAAPLYAIALGEERAGLSSPLRRLCDAEMRLPMTGRADSLNVAVAGGVMMYELLRQRQVSRVAT